jgi:predicted Zn-dependent protease
MSLLVAACTPVINPVSGEREYTAISQSEEIELGRAEHPKVTAEYGGAYDRAALQRYVTGIGDRLAAVSELPDLDFTFTLLDSDVVNAFALPGGYVYVTRGLLALADNEAEVAGVLAHEIGHVTARHTAQRMTQQQYGQAGAIGATILGAILLGDAGAQLGQQLGGLGAQAWVAGYSREQEFQADQLGVRYLAKAGYDPQAMATFLDALQQNDALQRRMRGQGGDAAGASFFASHPRTVERVERAAGEADATIATGDRIERDGYLEAIDGLLYGDNPAQGIVDGRTFIHPELGVRFTAPPGFRLINQPTAVVGQDESGRILIFDLARAAAADDPAGYLRQQGLQDVQRLELSEGTGAVGFGRVAFSDRPVPAVVAVAPTGGAVAARFRLLGPQGLDRSDLAGFEGMLRSVEATTAADKAAARPRHIEIVTVGPNDSIDSLAARMEVEALPRDTFIVLNDLDRRTLEPGDKVKIVRRG